jgi:2-amino-4-hydroxy-6-hydroxymethyldihydropteridine diphosphokinase
MSQCSYNHYDAIIALGSNMGDSSKVIYDSLQQLRSEGTLISTSFLYESKPKYYENQSTFLNAACLVRTTISDPNEIIFKLKEIEKKMGRKETFPNGPRLIDLDLIFFNNMTYLSPESSLFPLIIPHPRMHERAFVLKPILDINPDFQHPKLMKSIRQLWEDLSDQEKSSIKRILPLGKSLYGHRRQLVFDKPYYISAILNVTPDRLKYYQISL